MLELQIHQIERDLRRLARRQTGCRALMTQYGMGELSALITLCELGDVSRMHASRQAVRMAGIDIGVHRSDRTSRLGKLTRQGSAQLRWALYEAAQFRVPAREPRRRRLPRTEGARALTHPRVAHDRPQARPALLPPAPRARPRRPRTDRPLTHPAPPPTHHRCVTQLPASSRSDPGSRPRAAAHQRQSEMPWDVPIDVKCGFG